jgi:hypothetical protein
VAFVKHRAVPIACIHKKSLEGPSTLGYTKQPVVDHSRPLEGDR